MSETSLPRILIVSIPKGGTNLLMQAVLGIPGITQTRKNMFTSNTSAILKGHMGVMHLPYSRQIEKQLHTQNVKVIFISRDPRDIAVSMMYFILNSFPYHILYPAFQQYLTTNRNRLSAIINGVKFNSYMEDTVLANELHVASGFDKYPDIGAFCRPYLRWGKSRHSCHVTYEELAEASERRTAALQRIIDFLWDDMSIPPISRDVLVSKMEQNINPATSPTFRAGRIGDWKQEFDYQHKEDCKRIAGRMLIDLGYERGLSW